MTYTHEQVLDGARGVWASGGWVAVWHGGRTLNVYERAQCSEQAVGGGWLSTKTKQFMDQPERERVAETAQQVLQDLQEVRA